MSNREYAEYIIRALKENKNKDNPVPAAEVLEHYLNLYHEAIVVDLMRTGQE